MTARGVAVHVDFPPDLYRDLSARSRDDERSVEQFIRWAVRYALRYTTTYGPPPDSSEPVAEPASNGNGAAPTVDLTKTQQPLTYTVTEVSAIVGVTPRHIHRLIERGEMPAIRFGRRWVIPRVAVERMLAQALQ